ncbi:MAG: hypothetical protein AAFV78_08595 [Bacteroidota bacterium]
MERIREWLGDREVEASYAYGDSRGDREMLAWADQASTSRSPSHSLIRSTFSGP